MPRRPNYLKQYYIENRERIREYHRRHHADNRDKINSDKRAHRAENPEPDGSYGLSYQRAYKKMNRELVNERQRAYRAAHPEYFLRYNKSRNEKEYIRRRLFKAKINAYKAERGCVDCGIKNPIVLDFDHVRDKVFDVANGAARNPKLVEAEIAKCEIRCSNCHRIKTHERRMADMKLEF